MHHGLILRHTNNNNNHKTIVQFSLSLFYFTNINAKVEKDLFYICVCVFVCASVCYVMLYSFENNIMFGGGANPNTTFSISNYEVLFLREREREREKNITPTFC